MPLTFTESDFTDTKSAPLTFDESDFGKPSQPETKPDLSGVKISPYDLLFQPSEFSSGLPPGTPPSQNPDYAFTKALADPETGIIKASQKPIVPIPKFTINPDDSKTVAVGKSVINQLLGIPEFIESPMGLATLPVGGVAPKTVMTFFGLSAAKSAGEQILKANKEWDNYTPAEKAAAVTDIGGTIGLAALLGHGVKKNLAEHPHILDTPESAAIKELYQQTQNAPIGGIDPNLSPASIAGSASTEQPQGQVLPTQVATVESANVGKSPIPRAVRNAPIVPETPPESGKDINVLQALRIRATELGKTRLSKKEVKSVYPDLSNEESAIRRDQAFGPESAPTAEAPKSESFDENELNQLESLSATGDLSAKQVDRLEQLRTQSAQQDVPVEPLTHGDEVEATLPSGEKVNGHIVGADANGNALLLKKNKKLVTLPEKLTEETYAPKKSKTMEVFRNPPPGTAPQVATGIPSEVPKSAGAPASQEAGLPKENWRITVQEPQAFGEKTVPGYVQIDAVKGNENVWSKSPATLSKEGITVPDFSKLPQGKYTYDEAVKLLKASPETVKAPPASETPIVPTIEGQSKSAGGEADIQPQQGVFQGMGGAVPSEFGKPGDYVSNMFSSIDESRAKMGKPPMEKTKTRTWDEDNQRALAEMNRNPDWIPSLLLDVAHKPRPLLSWENAGVIWHRHKLTAELDNALERVNKAHEDRRVDDLKTANADVIDFENQLLDLDAVVGRNGAATEAGRSLKAQQMGGTDDFSLAQMRLEERATKNGGLPLTEKQSAEVNALYSKVSALQKKLKEAESKADNSARVKELQAKLDEILKQPKPALVEPHVLLIADKLKGFFDTQASAALERIKARRAEGRLFTGIDPSELADYAVYGASKILSKGINGGEMSAEWAKEMASEIGEFIAPHLNQIWKASQKRLDDELQKVTAGKVPKEKVKRAVKSMTVDERKARVIGNIKGKVDAGKTSEITKSVGELARLFVESGIHEREALIDAVHGVLKDIDPSISRRDAMDAISGYGVFKQLSKDEISVRTRDLKRQMQEVAKLEDMAAGKPPLKTGMPRSEWSKEQAKLQKLVNNAKFDFQVPSTDPSTQLQSALDTFKRTTKNRIDEYNEKIAAGDFTKTPKRRLELDKDALAASYELAKVKKQWHERMMKNRIANRNKIQKSLGVLVEASNTVRAILTSLDLSAVLRQGGFIALGHPVRALKAFPSMFKALRSEAGQHAVDTEILHRPNYRLYEKSKLYLSEHGQKLSQMEEAYMSRWADKIPLVAASQRAYVTFLNRLRADSFDAMAKSLSRDGEVTDKEASAISNFINVATGRGNLGMKENALVGLNTIFFAPRYVASRFQILSGQPLYRGTWGTRKLVAKEYGRFLAGAAVVYGLAQMAGATIEEDPRSSDFGKLKFGNTRIDPLAGLLQNIVLIARLVSGKTKTPKGNIVPIRGDKVPYGSSNAADILFRFVRSKLAPIPGTLLDITTGKNVAGNKVTPESAAKNLVTPIGLSDIYSAMKDQGIAAGTAMAILSLFGMGLQTYTPKNQNQ